MLFLHSNSTSKPMISHIHIYCFQHIRMISEESCDMKTGVNSTVILNYFTILLFYCVFDQINAVLVSIRGFLLKSLKKNLIFSKLLNGSVCGIISVYKMYLHTFSTFHCVSVLNPLSLFVFIPVFLVLLWDYGQVNGTAPPGRQQNES